jgi:hypothetical protein
METGPPFYTVESGPPICKRCAIDLVDVWYAEKRYVSNLWLDVNVESDVAYTISRHLHSFKKVRRPRDSVWIQVGISKLGLTGSFHYFRLGPQLVASLILGDGRHVAIHTAGVGNAWYLLTAFAEESIIYALLYAIKDAMRVCREEEKTKEIQGHQRDLVYSLAPCERKRRDAGISNNSTGFFDQ